jgi:hypothetical protein
MSTMRSMFGGGQQQQRGKAPRNYQRSDERLREMICERLMETSGIDASDVEVEVQAGRVTLEGNVDSRMAKYQIEDMVEAIGVSDVQNNLRISRNGESSSGSASSAPGSRSSQTGSSGGASSLGMSGSGSMGDRTLTGSSGSGGSGASSGSTSGSSSAGSRKSS